MTARLLRNVALAVKAEAVPGTREVITLADDRAQIMSGAIPQRDYIARNSRGDFLTGSLSREADAQPVGEFVRIPIRFAPQGAGVAYAAAILPSADVFLRGAGFGANVDTTAGAEKATYTLADFPESTFSADYYAAGLRWELAGCVLESLSLACDAGSFPLIDATLMGRVVAVADALPFTIPAYPALQSLTWRGAGSLTLGAYVPQIQRITVGLQNTVQPNVDANADAFAHFQVVDRNPTAEVGIRVPALASYDPRALEAARTEFALAARFGLATDPAGKYKRLKLSAGRVYIRDHQPVADGQFWNYTLTLAFAEHAQELDFVFD